MKIKAFKIDVENKKIEKIEIEPTLSCIYFHIGCRSVDVLRPYEFNTDIVYIDDEGLFNNEPGAFSIRGMYGIFQGNGLVVGTTSDGEDSNITIAIEKLQELVKFEDPHYLPEPRFLFID